MKPPRRPRAYAPDPSAPQGRGCDMPGCPAAGEYRAPKSRAQLNDYWWFCLQHVRAYNAAWDYYRGMSPAEIEGHIRRDTAWDRPTWPLGQLAGGSPMDRMAEDGRLRDPLGLLRGGARRTTAHAAESPPPELRQPLAVLDLTWPVALDDVKIRYKTLAKRWHPDANGGDRAAEERLKEINLAYTALRNSLTPPPARAAG